LIYDSHYDPFRGVVVHFRIFEGTLREGDEIKLMASRGQYKTEDVGRFKIILDRTKVLRAGDVGYFIAGIKTISDVRVGDTITTLENPAKEALGGFKEVKPVVFSSIYPIDADDYSELTKALENSSSTTLHLSLKRTVRRLWALASNADS
jgi:GTP-binding protein LepA